MSEELASKKANEVQNAPVRKFPSDISSSVHQENSNNSEQKDESTEHKRRFNFHITRQSSSSSVDVDSNSKLQMQQQQSPLIQHQDIQHQQQQNLPQQPQNLPQQQNIQQQPLSDSQQRKKILRDQIADLSAKIEKNTRDNERYRNQLGVLKSRVEALLKKSQDNPG